MVTQHFSIPLICTIIIRIIDIFLGFLLLLSHLLLAHGSLKERKYSVTIFFIISFATLLLYWTCFAYLKYALKESEASKEVRSSNIYEFSCLVNFSTNSKLFNQSLRCPFACLPQTSPSNPKQTLVNLSIYIIDIQQWHTEYLSYFHFSDTGYGYHPQSELLNTFAANLTVPQSDRQKCRGRDTVIKELEWK